MSNLASLVPANPDAAASLEAHLMTGGTLTSWCELHPTFSTVEVMSWVQRDPDFAARYYAAREAGADFLAERMRTVAATASDHPDDVAHRRLQIETDKWLLSRWSPRRYGDKQRVEHAGGVTLHVTTGVPSNDESPQGHLDG